MFMTLPTACPKALLTIPVLLALLTGCASNSVLDKDARFNANLATEPETKALIVVGARIVHEPVYRHWLLGDVSQHPSYSVSIIGFTDDGHLRRSGSTFRICESMRDLAPYLSSCVPSQRQYKVIAVPPGRYALGGISYTLNKITSNTNFVKPLRSRGSTASDGIFINDVFGIPPTSFVLQAGDVVYIGDLSFDFPYDNPFASVRVTRDDTAARRALAEYPNVNGTLEFKPMDGGGSFKPPPGT